MQKSISLKINKLRQKKRLSVKELAEIIGKTERTILNYTGNRTKIDIDTLAEIAKALDVPVSYFFEETGGDVPVASAKGPGGCEKYLKEISELKSRIIDLQDKLYKLA